MRGKICRRLGSVQSSGDPAPGAAQTVNKRPKLVGWSSTTRRWALAKTELRRCIVCADTGWMGSQWRAIKLQAGSVDVRRKQIKAAESSGIEFRLRALPLDPARRHIQWQARRPSRTAVLDRALADPERFSSPAKHFAPSANAWPNSAIYNRSNPYTVIPNSFPSRGG